MMDGSSHSVPYSTSSLPSRTSSYRQPPRPAVHTLNRHSAAYTNYSGAFSESTAYDNSNVIASAPTSAPQSRSSSLTRNNSTRQIEAIGSKFFNAISETVKSPAAAEAVSRTKSLHQRARSLAAFVPSLSSLAVEEQAGSSSPQRQRPFSPLSGGGDNNSRPSTAHTQEEEREDEERYSNPIMDYKPTLTGADRPSRISNRPPPASRATVGPSTFRKFAWFGGSKQESTQNSAPTQPEVNPSNADFLKPASSLLLPNGTPNPQDPNAFADLLKNAETVIGRLQTAYKQSENKLKLTRQWRETAVEEAAEADTRARHLRSQLDEMINIAMEHDRAYQRLAEELAFEKEKARRARSVEQQDLLSRRAPGAQEPMSKRRAGRSSAGSSNSMSSIASDSGFESDYCAENETENDPTSPARSFTPFNGQQNWNIPRKEIGSPTSRGSMNNWAGTVDGRALSHMREEKVRLERRVRELEGVVDSCLDLVSRV